MNSQVAGRWDRERKSGAGRGCYEPIHRQRAHTRVRVHALARHGIQSSPPINVPLDPVCRTSLKLRHRALLPSRKENGRDVRKRSTRQNRRLVPTPKRAVYEVSRCPWDLNAENNRSHLISPPLTIHRSMFTSIRLIAPTRTSSVPQLLTVTLLSC